MSFRQLERRLAVQAYKPDQLLWFFRLAPRIRILAEIFKVTAAGVDDGYSICGPRKLSNLFTIVFAIRSQLPSLVLGWLGHPHVPHAFCILHPGDFAARSSSNQIRRERRTHHLFERKLLLWRLSLS